MQHDNLHRNFLKVTVMMFLNILPGSFSNSRFALPAISGTATHGGILIMFFLAFFFTSAGCSGNSNAPEEHVKETSAIKNVDPVIGGSDTSSVPSLPREGPEKTLKGLSGDQTFILKVTRTGPASIDYSMTQVSKNNASVTRNSKAIFDNSSGIFNDKTGECAVSLRFSEKKSRLMVIVRYGCDVKTEIHLTEAK